MIQSKNMIPPIPSYSRPALWNPNAAACWSLLFTPAFGAYLHARNADSLGRAEEAKAHRVWFYVSLGYLGFVLVSVFIPAIPEAVFRGAAIGILMGWYFTQGQKQVQHVKETCQTGYQRRSWKKPLLIAFGCLVGYLIVVIVLAIVAESFFGIA
ncbi:MAG: Uncharacterized protein JWQ71_3623 [Pedosphaera sp.]|nr:Uncharacterized protein [Pedosphaera sp.]